MPGYKTHLTGGAVVSGGALAGLLYLGYYEPEPLAAASLIAIAMMASLFPDVDTSSMGRKLFYAIMAFTDLVLIVNKHYEWAALLGLFAMLPAVGNHRGWTHTWWAMLVVPLPIMLIPLALYPDASWQEPAPYYAAAVLGYFSHLALDRKF